MRRLSTLIAFLPIALACAAVPGPASYAQAGPVQSDATNQQFLDAVSFYSDKYFDTTGTPTAGDDFSFAHGMPSTIPGYGGQVGVRIWFESESSDYHNALGVTLASDDSIVFADSQARSFGDYVDLNGGGIVGPAMHFFALANVIGDQAQYLWQGPKGLNVDKKTHIDVSWKAPFYNAGSLWYALALDDQNVDTGSDRDWNDLRVLIQLRPVTTPEPATIALLAGFAAIAAWMWSRQRQLVA